MQEFYTVSIPGSILQEMVDGIQDQADEGNEDMATLFAKIEAAPVKTVGRGCSVTVDLNWGEFCALKGEVVYKEEYWNTDAYGLKSSGGSDPVIAWAAKRLLSKMRLIQHLP